MRYVNLVHGCIHQQRVAYGDAGVGVPAGVDQDGIGIKSVCLNGINEFAFDID